MSWASSTWALPSRDRACRAKMSRIKAVRSTTFVPRRSSRFRSCPGVSSSSKITASAPEACTAPCSSASFPRPTNVAGSGLGRLCTTRATGSAPAVTARAASSSRSDSEAPGPAPTSTARSRTVGRHVAESGDSETNRSGVMTSGGVGGTQDHRGGGSLGAAWPHAPAKTRGRAARNKSCSRNSETRHGTGNASAPDGPCDPLHGLGQPVVGDGQGDPHVPLSPCSIPPPGSHHDTGRVEEQRREFR